MLEPIRQGGPLHPAAARSVFWETMGQVDDPAFEKEAWISATLLERGECGFTLQDQATIFFCGRDRLPGVAKLPTGPISPDAEAISSAFVSPARLGRGVEAVLIDAAIMALCERGCEAVEAFGFYGEDRAVRELLGFKPAHIGLLPIAHLEGAGFEVVVDHPVVPRLRLELPPRQQLLSAAAVEDVLAKAFA